MSKAFTRESDDEFDQPVLARPSSTAQNYLTPDGAQRLRLELERLTEQLQRSETSSDPGTGHQHLQPVRQRIRHLQESLRSAAVIPPPPPPWNRVQFGATVTVRDASRNVSSYRIVGADESDADRGWVSLLSPIAKALINQSVGQRVSFTVPDGKQDLEIMDIEY